MPSEKPPLDKVTVIRLIGGVMLFIPILLFLGLAIYSLPSEGLTVMGVLFLGTIWFGIAKDLYYGNFD